MLSRALIVWVVLLLLAIANGALREGLIVPRVGTSTGHVLSPIALCAGILLLSWLLIEWVHPVTSRDAWMIGAVWVVLTLAFEFLAGHYLFGHPWSRLLADYNVLRGRIWVLVLVTTAVAPTIVARARGLLVG
jgi:hypothetical protein